MINHVDITINVLFQLVDLNDDRWYTKNLGFLIFLGRFLYMVRIGNIK